MKKLFLLLVLLFLLVILLGLASDMITSIQTTLLQPGQGEVPVEGIKSLLAQMGL